MGTWFHCFIAMQQTKYLQLNNISSYKSSFLLSNHVWKIVIEWDFFAKDTVGKQMVRSFDSISANIAEGFGRYGKKDKIKFNRYAAGSVKESLDWNEKCLARDLISKVQHDYLLQQLNELSKDINSLIKYTNNKLSD